VATEAQVIRQVRRRVADYKETTIYEDEYYQDAISFALGKLGTDLGTTYATVPSVEVGYVYLLVLVASVDVCYMRAADDASDEEDLGDISSISVPDLSISSSTDSDTQDAASWLDLAERYQRQYDDGISQAGGAALAATIQESTLNRTSLTTGGLANRKLDPGLDAVTVAASVSGSTVTLTWDTLYSNHFKYYEVYRSQSATMAGEERIKIIDDNHTVTMDDENLVAGTYYYRVKTVNPNDLKTDSNIVSAVV